MTNFTITLPGGFQVPVPAWATTAFGVLSVVGISFGMYRYFYPVTPELITAQQANKQLTEQVQHYNTHMFETAVASLVGDDLTVRVFADDCLIIGRKQTTRLLIAEQTHEASTGLVPVVYAEQGCRHQGGQFTSAYGNRLDQCWVEVWRTFTDGCQHVQHLNTCSGAFESNPDGSPRVRWTRCNH